MFISIVIGALGTITEDEEGTGGLGKKRTSEDHPNYCIVEIDQNTEKSPVDLKRVAVTQTPVKDHQLTLQHIVNESKNRRKNLAMVWINYKMAYDMVPQSWIINSLKMYKISHETINFMEKNLKNWRIELTA